MIARNIPTPSPIASPPAMSRECRRLASLSDLDHLDERVLGDAVAAAPLMTVSTAPSIDDIGSSAKILRAFSKTLAARCAGMFAAEAFPAHGDVRAELATIVETIAALEVARAILGCCAEEAQQ